MALDCPQRGQGPLCPFYTLSLASASAPLWWTTKSRVPAFLSLVVPAVPGWGSGMPRDVAWQGFHSHSLCCGQPARDSPPFSLSFLPFLSCSESLCPKVAELGRVSRAGVAFGFGLSVLHSIRDFTKRRRPRKAPFHHRLFIHHALVMPLCYPEHSCWAQREDWSSSLGAGLEGGGRNAPRAAPS